MEIWLHATTAHLQQGSSWHRRLTINLTWHTCHRAFKVTGLELLRVNYSSQTFGGGTLWFHVMMYRIKDRKPWVIWDWFQAKTVKKKKKKTAWVSFTGQSKGKQKLNIFKCTFRTEYWVQRQIIQAVDYTGHLVQSLRPKNWYLTPVGFLFLWLVRMCTRKGQV